MTDPDLRATLRRPRALAALAGITLLLGACATPGPDRAAPAARTPQSLGLSDARTAPLDTRWWAAFGDPTLDALVAHALQDHPTVQAAQARVERALALAGAVRAADGPQAGVGADLSRQRYSEHGLIPKPIAGATWSSANVQATLSWSPDLFGQHAAEVGAAVDQARAAQADAAVAATGLATQLARSYVGLARWLAQRALAERTLAQREEMLALTRRRVEAGLDTRLELTQGQGAIPDARVQIEAIDEQVALARRQIAVLAGQAPEALAALAPRLDALKAVELPATLGADLLGRRPDVVAARWRIEAATQDVAAARAQFYPNVNLAAFVGLNSIGLNQLVDVGSRQYGVAPALRLPLFDGGRLRAQQGARQAELAGAVAQYDGVLLDAVKEAGDAIGSAASVERQLHEQAAALASAETAHSIARQRHAAGLGSYLVVLNAETQWLAQRRAAVELQARRLDSRIALMKALGGGWIDETSALAAAAR